MQHITLMDFILEKGRGWVIKFRKEVELKKALRRWFHQVTKINPTRAAATFRSWTSLLLRANSMRIHADGDVCVAGGCGGGD